MSWPPCEHLPIIYLANNPSPSPRGGGRKDIYARYVEGYYVYILMYATKF
jgi:hypothetical protein